MGWKLQSDSKEQHKQEERCLGSKVHRRTDRWRHYIPLRGLRKVIIRNLNGSPAFQITGPSLTWRGKNGGKICRR